MPFYPSETIVFESQLPAEVFIRELKKFVHSSASYRLPVDRKKTFFIGRVTQRGGVRLEKAYFTSLAYSRSAFPEAVGSIRKTEKGCIVNLVVEGPKGGCMTTFLALFLFFWLVIAVITFTPELFIIWLLLVLKVYIDRKEYLKELKAIKEKVLFTFRKIEESATHAPEEEKIPT